MTSTAQAYEWVKTGHWSLRQFREWFDTQQRTWVGLTEQEALDCFSPNPVTHSKNVEAKLKEKNFDTRIT